MTSQPRLYVSGDLTSGAQILLRQDQIRYLRRVMRIGDQGVVCLFNGRDGEWLAQPGASWSAPLQVTDQLALQTPTQGPELWFSPLRPGRTAYLVEKATELGVCALRPIRTRHSRPGSLKRERLQRICEEASEQTGRHDVPVVHRQLALEEALLLAGVVAFCDEDRGEVGFSHAAGHAEAVLIGPEGGFTDQERAMLGAHGTAIPVGLGPRILRAETAAVCALALWHGRQGTSA